MRLTPETLRVVRKVMGCTQKRLAQMVGVTDEYISMIEGRKCRFTDDMERRIRRALNLTDERIAEVARLCERLQVDKKAI